MENRKIIVNGGKRLSGIVNISGSKNASLPIIAASLLTRDTVTLKNVPEISDTKLLLDIVEKMGVSVVHSAPNEYVINARNLRDEPVLHEGVSKMRASYYLLGVLLGRFQHAETAYPGGCNLGLRPIDLHIKGFSALGALVETGSTIKLKKWGQLSGKRIFLDTASVGATINIMLAAVLISGTTIIENAAKEPHIVDTANFLNTMGANIKGAGTDTIRIKGVRKLHGATYSVIPDQIEAGTMMVAAAITKGNVVINNVIPKHLEAVTAKLRDVGVDVLEGETQIRVIGKGEYVPTRIKTVPHPGFPTDMQPQFTTLLSTIKGTSVVSETVMASRFKFIEELRKMGADVTVEGSVAILNGGKELYGADVKAFDLRAGAAMIIAGLSAEGETRISEIEHIERGYEDIVGKLRSIGADITVINNDENDKREIGRPLLKIIS